MNYENFLIYKENLLKNKKLINLSENNLYSYYKNNMTYDFSGHINGIVYRCHLVEDWLNYYGLNQNLKKHIGVSNGVRNSIEIISKKLNKSKFLIPKDVYPFYQKTLNNNNITFEEYSTLGVNELFKDINNKAADIMLLTDPLKPLGRDILNIEYENIEKWLKKDKSRLLIVDGVYTLDNRLNDYILNLYEKTNQVILLYSLSKSWRLPNYFGISIFPKNDFGENLREDYKKLEKNQEKLNYAFMALNKYKDEPLYLKKLLQENQKKLKELNPYFKELKNNSEKNPSYLLYSERDFQEWLNDGILVIPASVFGGERGSIYSLLF